MREWLDHAVRDIVSIYSINANTIYGTIQEGPDSREYHRMSEYSLDQIEEFYAIWKVFAVHLYSAMQREVRPFEDEVMRNEDDVDINCHVLSYQLGCAAVEISARQRYYPPEKDYSHQWP